MSPQLRLKRTLRRSNGTCNTRRKVAQSADVELSLREVLAIWRDSEKCFCCDSRGRATRCNCLTNLCGRCEDDDINWISLKNLLMAFARGQVAMADSRPKDMKVHTQLYFTVLDLVGGEDEELCHNAIDFIWRHSLIGTKYPIRMFREQREVVREEKVDELKRTTVRAVFDAIVRWHSARGNKRRWGRKKKQRQDAVTVEKKWEGVLEILAGSEYTGCYQFASVEQVKLFASNFGLNRIDVIANSNLSWLERKGHTFRVLEEAGSPEKAPSRWSGPRAYVASLGEESEKFLEEWGRTFNGEMKFVSEQGMLSSVQFKAAADGFDGLFADDTNPCQSGYDELVALMGRVAKVIFKFGKEWTFRASFVKSGENWHAQPPHLNVHRRVCNQYVVAFTPLTKDGMFLQIWPKCGTANEKVEGRIVFIPFGQILFLSADVIHGGGFLSNAQSQNACAHFLIRAGSTIPPSENFWMSETDFLIHNRWLLKQHENHPLSKTGPGGSALPSGLYRGFLLEPSDREEASVEDEQPAEHEDCGSNQAAIASCDSSCDSTLSGLITSSKDGSEECEFCSNPQLAGSVTYKCGTQIKKFFPEGPFNPNSGWYKGEIVAHSVESGINPASASSAQILARVVYEDGDVEHLSEKSLLQDLKVEKIRPGSENKKSYSFGAFRIKREIRSQGRHVAENVSVMATSETDSSESTKTVVPEETKPKMQERGELVWVRHGCVQYQAYRVVVDNGNNEPSHTSGSLLPIIWQDRNQRDYVSAEDIVGPVFSEGRASRRQRSSISQAHNFQNTSKSEPIPNGAVASAYPLYMDVVIPDSDPQK